jgi:hypothetical protein
VCQFGAGGLGPPPGGSGTFGLGTAAGGGGAGRPPVAVGTTAAEAEDGGPEPTEFVAVTVKV